jgi:hypothetical protein
MIDVGSSKLHRAEVSLGVVTRAVREELAQGGVLKGS